MDFLGLNFGGVCLLAGVQTKPLHEAETLFAESSQLPPGLVAEQTGLGPRQTCVIQTKIIETVSRGFHRGLINLQLAFKFQDDQIFIEIDLPHINVQRKTSLLNRKLV